MDLMRRRLLMAGNGLKDYTIFGKSEVVGSSVLGVGDVKNWCQLAKKLAISQTANGVSYHYNTDNSVTFNGTATANTSFYNLFNVSNNYIDSRPSHKIYHAIKVVSGSKTGSTNIVSDGYATNGSPLSASTPERIYTTSSAGSYTIMPKIVAGDVFDNLTFFYNWIDLTAIFGSGNEPTSVEGFKSWLVSVGKMKSADGDIPYFPYDAGSTFASLPIVALKGYESVNLGDLAWYKLSDGKFYTAWYNISDYDIKISGNKILHGYTQLPNDSSWNILVDHTYGVSTSGDTFRLMLGNTDYTLASALKTALTGTMFYYERESATEVSSTTFPLAISSPLHGVGTADYAKFTDKGITRKFGVVDLGSRTWDYDSSRSWFQTSRTTISPLPKGNSMNLMCHLYSVVNGVSPVVTTNMSMYMAGSTLVVHNDSYTDAETFQTAMSGVYLVYELAEETFESVKLPKLPKFKDGTLVYTDTEIHGNITTE